jgi:hypothetical protein
MRRPYRWCMDDKDNAASGKLGAAGGEHTSDARH